MTLQVHAVGLYGPRGAGVAEHLDYDIHKAAGNSPHPIKGTVMDRVDIITGTHLFLSTSFFHFPSFQARLGRRTVPLADTLLGPMTLSI
jgi:hypothetical protein